MAQIKYNLGDLGTEVYSTNETVVGTWIDGKPIYRKTFQIPTITNSYDMNIAGLNVDKILKINGFCTTSSNLRVDLYYYDGSFRFCCYANPTTISFFTIGTITNCFTTIEYTKTTDA